MEILFFRRALRIWPLYFAALGTAYLIGHLLPAGFRISRKAILLMALFVANWTAMAPSLGLLISHLWSISVEEQFYLMWPPIIKIGGRTAAFCVSCLFLVLGAMWIWVFADRGWLLWYDTPVEFLFFAAGALLSVVLRGRAISGAKALVRSGLIIAGITVLWIAALWGRVEMSPAPGLVKLTLRYGGALIGCVLIFLALLGIPYVPRVLLYVDKISYGLYVFHLAVFQFTHSLTAPLHLPRGSILNLTVVDCVALLLTVGASMLSYNYLEKPFMHMKERFAIIPSRRHDPERRDFILVQASVLHPLRLIGCTVD
jgi:peptidoglycan/LPS O-acetylase OafA/YrhL